MKPTFDENYLRSRLRDEWKDGPLIWVEAARGGSDGAPDVFCPLGGKRGYIPVELKKWEIVKSVIQFEARPSQRRFHTLAARANLRTAFLVLLPNLDVALLPGAMLPAETVPVFPPKLMIVSGKLSNVRWGLLSERFWSGEY